MKQFRGAELLEGWEVDQDCLKMILLLRPLNSQNSCRRAWTEDNLDQVIRPASRIECPASVGEKAHHIRKVSYSGIHAKNPPKRALKSWRNCIKIIQFPEDWEGFRGGQMPRIAAESDFKKSRFLEGSKPNLGEDP